MNWFYKDFLVFSKAYFKNFKFYGEASKSGIVQLNSIIRLEFYQRISKNGLDRAGIFVKGWISIIIEIFGENWLKFVEK